MCRPGLIPILTLYMLTQLASAQDHKLLDIPGLQTKYWIQGSMFVAGRSFPPRVYWAHEYQSKVVQIKHYRRVQENNSNRIA